ncbi:GapS1 family protein [Pseudomonas kurunegalensis]|uniref:GapS1 family protein n=1 Tax=Pseudomonas kurunegalensis TaxID=485880 RepID=UPI003261C9CE
MNNKASYALKIEKLKQELSQFEHFSIIEAFLSVLISNKGGDIDTLRRMPWLQLFFLKLALQGESGRRKMNKGQLVALMNRLYSFQADAAQLDEGDLELNLRPMLLQQMWYQKGESYTLLTMFRQRLLFQKSNPWYGQKFKEITGLSLDNFYAITIFLLLRTQGHKATALEINLAELLHKLCPAIPPLQVASYFQLLGIRTCDLAIFMRQHNLDDIYPSEYFQDTPIRFRPILINVEQLLIIDIQLFLISITEFVPVFLKTIPTHKDQFGKDFEGYLQTLLRTTGMEIWSESQEISQFYSRHGIKGKIVDYLAVSNDRVILFESKAVEPSSVVKTSASAEVLERNLRPSFIKGIKQGIETAFHLASTEDFKGKKFSLLVVTHEDFGIYGGRWIAEHVDKDLPKWVADNFPTSPLDLDDIFYCTAADIEDLARGHSSSAFDICDILAQATTRGVEPPHRKMVFRQQLSKLSAKGAPFHKDLSEEMKSSILEFTNIFSLNKSQWGDQVGSLLYLRNKLISILNSIPLQALTKK